MAKETADITELGILGGEISWIVWVVKMSWVPSQVGRERVDAEEEGDVTGESRRIRSNGNTSQVMRTGFSGRPEAKIPHSQCGRPGLIPHAAPELGMPQGAATMAWCSQINKY